LKCRTKLSMKENEIGMPPVLSGTIIPEMGIMVVQYLLCRLHIHMHAHARKAWVPTMERPPVTIKVAYLVKQPLGTPQVVRL
jgi:hypothetical protein